MNVRHLRGRRPFRTRDFWRVAHDRRSWSKELSGSYDLFIALVHEAPVRSYARQSFLIVLFPFFAPFDVWAGKKLEGGGRSALWSLLRHLAFRSQWRKSIVSYRWRTSISEYTRRWTQIRWKVDTEVLYPPCDATFSPATKDNLILSVGRFTTPRSGGVSKRQLELMELFTTMCREGLTTYQYCSMGNVGGHESDVLYLDKVRAAAARLNGRAVVAADVSRETARDLHGRSKIFWHAAGFGDDENLRPELMEHFGIATVDAMASGCVPVVIKKGAQPELVEHGISGFLWETLEELKSYTRLLIEDQPRRRKMAEAAQARAQRFSRETFVRTFRDFIRPLAEQRHPAEPLQF
jgi:glycosyltransferase involved in cell wall biosynthesis